LLIAVLLGIAGPLDPVDRGGLPSTP
jgi:hypothetical protein